MSNLHSRKDMPTFSQWYGPDIWLTPGAAYLQCAHFSLPEVPLQWPERQLAELRPERRLMSWSIWQAEPIVSPFRRAASSLACHFGGIRRDRKSRQTNTKSVHRAINKRSLYRSSPCFHVYNCYEESFVCVWRQFFVCIIYRRPRFMHKRTKRLGVTQDCGHEFTSGKMWRVARGHGRPDGSIVTTFWCAQDRLSQSSSSTSLL